MCLGLIVKSMKDVESECIVNYCEYAKVTSHTFVLAYIKASSQTILPLFYHIATSGHLTLLSNTLDLFLSSVTNRT